MGPTGRHLADAGDVAGFVDHEVVVGGDVGEVPRERVIVIRAPNDRVSGGLADLALVAS